jgi:hypothetical protein
MLTPLLLRPISRQCICPRHVSPSPRGLVCEESPSHFWAFVVPPRPCPSVPTSCKPSSRPVRRASCTCIDLLDHARHRRASVGGVAYLRSVSGYGRSRPAPLVCSKMGLRSG